MTAYELLHMVHPILAWCRYIWKLYIPPSRSILCWKIFRNRLPTWDKLIARGMCLTSVCLLCFNAIETVSHLFLDCLYVCVL